MRVDKMVLVGMFSAVALVLMGFGLGQSLMVSREEPEQVLGKEVKTSCTTIQSGELKTSDGRTIEPGFDEWEYNYQARIFNGGYCDAYRDAAWCQPYKDVDLAMKWNDAWLSNKDCDADGLLDRHLGSSGYEASGAWLTNHQSGSYDQNGRTEYWNYFVKIVAAPEGAESVDGTWFTAEGDEIGEAIWGAFAIVQQVNNDTGTGEHGIETLSPIGPGFGRFR